MLYELKQILLPFGNDYQNVIVDQSEGSKGLSTLANTLILSPNHRTFAQDLISILNDSVEVDSDLIISHLINIAQLMNPQQNVNSDFLRQTLNDFITQKTNLDPVFNGTFKTSDMTTSSVSGVELSIFQLYQISVMHMWVTDDKNISNKSLKDTQLIIMNGFGLNREARKDPSILEVGNNKQMVDEFNQVKSFLASTANQATDLGLQLARENLHFEDVVVFYKNESFQTLLKAKDDVLYILAPILESDLNWRSIQSVNGTGDEFLSTITNKSQATNEVTDEEFARQLQMQEDERYAQRLTSRNKSTRTGDNSQYIKKKQKQVKKNMKEAKLKKKKKSCVVM